MAKSIMPYNLKNRCYICHANCPTEEHHIFQGSNRANAEKYGLKIDACRICHKRAHKHPTEFEEQYKLKARAQEIAMIYYGWTIDEWREKFRKDYR